MSPLVQKMGLPWITVTSLTQAKKLYVDTLGFTITEEHPDYGWMEVSCGGTTLGIYQAGNSAGPEGSGDTPGQNAVLTFTVSDIDHAISVMRKAGITFVGQIAEMPGVFRMVTFLDADKNKCQLYQSLNK